jgi:hypothetical protein
MASNMVSPTSATLWAVLNQRPGQRTEMPPGADRRSTNNVYAHTRTVGFGDEVKRRMLLGTYALTAEYVPTWTVLLLLIWHAAPLTTISSRPRPCDGVSSPTSITCSLLATSSLRRRSGTMVPRLTSCSIPRLFAPLLGSLWQTVRLRMHRVDWTRTRKMFSLCLHLSQVSQR